MKQRTLLCILLILFVNSPTYAEAERFNLESLFSDEHTDSKERTTFLILRYQNIKTKVSHDETSLNSDFTSLGVETETTVHNISIEGGEEFFAEKYFSITLGARLGINKGSVKESNDTRNVFYEEQVSGRSYSAGISLNINTVGYGLKVQPFISSYYSVSKNDFNLSYHFESNSSEIYNTNYSFDRTSLEHSLGIRFIDKDTNLLSYFSIDYHQDIKNTSNVSGSYSGGSLELDNMSSEDQNDFGFSLGFGFLF